MVTLTEKNVQLVVGRKGKPTGVLVDLKTWEKILEALEDAEDIEIAREALAEIDAAGGDLEKAGYIPWSKVRAELEKMDDKK
ncbi:type II toxin-antitoxin system Phd/YefM family antitoxin [Chloroflexi bacterium CFX6]|nr:type II toxin-antitoxin system Phd/YefM family antitoxin [Chloroflexi bacterium CFX6]